MVRSHRKTKTWQRQNKQNTYPCRKKRLTTRVSGSPQIQKHCRNPPWMRHRLMYDTGEKNGEMTSKFKKWRRKNKPNHLLMWKKNALRLEAPVPRRSKHTAAIRIECGIDWCMIQVKQLVRSDRNRKKGPHWNTHQSTKNGVTEPQRQICAHPTAFSLSTFDYRSIDVWYK